MWENEQSPTRAEAAFNPRCAACIKSTIYLLPSSPAGSFALTASKQARKLSSLVESSSNGTIWPRARTSESCGFPWFLASSSPSFCCSIALKIFIDGEFGDEGSSRPANTYTTAKIENLQFSIYNGALSARKSIFVSFLLPCNQLRRGQGRSVDRRTYRSSSRVRGVCCGTRTHRWHSSIAALDKPVGQQLSSRELIFAGPEWPQFQHPSCHVIFNLQSRSYISITVQFKPDHTNTSHFRNAPK